MAIYTRCVVILLLFTSVLAGSETGNDLASHKRLRRPCALAWWTPGEKILVANRSGSVSIVNVATGKVLGETRVGEQLSDILGPLPNGCYLATDDAAHRLILLRPAKHGCEIVQRIQISEYPSKIAWDAKRGRAYVSCRWSRRLSVVDLPIKPADPAFVAATIDLPYAPHSLLVVSEHDGLVIADAFGGRLSWLNTKTLQVIRTQTFAAHKIRGLARNPKGDTLIVAHQMLNELAHTVRNDVHWGLLMSNDLRWIPLRNVTEGKKLYTNAYMLPLGEANSATADPEDIATAADGTVIVALGGVGELGIGKEGELNIRRVQVGRRPTAVALAGKTGVVANTFGDSLSVVDIDKAEVTRTISLGPERRLTSVERGELVFYDARLSHDSWMSCNSCHPDGHTNGLMNDNFSDASFGAPKRVLSLLGRHDTAPFSWRGTTPDLKAQIVKSVRQTMQGHEDPTAKQLQDLVAYLASLPIPPSIDVTRGTVNRKAIKEGKRLFSELGCVSCHAPPKFTTPATYDVGLVDKEGVRKFNPPSLLGVGQRGPYFHNNSAASLHDVFRKFKHQIPRKLDERELAALLAYLRSL